MLVSSWKASRTLAVDFGHRPGHPSYRLIASMILIARATNNEYAKAIWVKNVHNFKFAIQPIKIHKLNAISGNANNEQSAHWMNVIHKLYEFLCYTIKLYGVCFSADCIKLLWLLLLHSIWFDRSAKLIRALNKKQLKMWLKRWQQTGLIVSWRKVVKIILRKFVNSRKRTF